MCHNSEHEHLMASAEAQVQATIAMQALDAAIDAASHLPVVVVRLPDGSTVAVTSPHPCTECRCEDELTDHCEGHFEVAAMHAFERTIGPCGGPVQL